MRQKLLGIIITVACTALAVACTDSPPTPNPNKLTIDPFVDELWRQHLDNLTLTEDLSLTEVYGDQWKEYAIFCGYTHVASVAEELGITEYPFGKNTRVPENSTYLYLSDKAGSQEWIEVLVGVDLCRGDDVGIASLAPASKPQYFKLTDSGSWNRIKSPSQSSTAPTTAAETPHHQN